MIQDVLQEMEKRMQGAVNTLRQDLATIRTGRASPALVERLKVEYYGTLTPLNQMATISAPEARLLTIRPYDPSSLEDVEKAILKSDLGLTPNNDGEMIRLVIPRLTEERRQELVRISASKLEESRVAVRNIRRDGLRDLRELESEGMISEDAFYRAKDDLQELTDKYIEQIDKIGEAKREEIMEV